MGSIGRCNEPKDHRDTATNQPFEISLAYGHTADLFLVHRSPPMIHVAYSVWLTVYGFHTKCAMKFRSFKIAYIVNGAF